MQASGAPNAEQQTCTRQHHQPLSQLRCPLCEQVAYAASSATPPRLYQVPLPDGADPIWACLGCVQLIGRARRQARRLVAVGRLVEQHWPDAEPAPVAPVSGFGNRRPRLRATPSSI